jgi:hypothetical protein
MLEIHHPKELQDKEYDGDDDQSVNPAASFREARTDIATEKTEQPQDYKNNDNGPQHKISPFYFWLGSCEGGRPFA